MAPPSIGEERKDNMIAVSGVEPGSQLSPSPQRESVFPLESAFVGRGTSSQFDGINANLIAAS